MRTGVSTVQQTLTTEAANVLKAAVAEAQRRGHVQVTPLHVATTLLNGSGGGGGGGGGFSSVLRHACVQSHLHLPNPPQCRALELCFSVALDRLQTTASAAAPSSGSPSSPTPALSNALVAALKRAQAHQRRGYPEQQQVPLLAVKVEMDQLVISILDDPSVSRVMREAKFSSTQVKNSLEEAMAAAAAAAGPRLIGAAAAANVDRLKLKLGSSLDAGVHHHGYHHHRIIPLPPSTSLPRRTHAPEVARMIDVLLRGGGATGGGIKRRNPLLIGEQHPPHGVVEEFFSRIEQQPQSFDHDALRDARIFSPQFASIALGLHGRDEVDAKLRELAAAVERCSAAIVFLGDLQWLVERSPSGGTPASYCPVNHAINEISRMVAGSCPSRCLWLVGVSSSQTYIRCQSRHPSLETLWGLQPLPIASPSSLINSTRISSLETGRPNSHLEYTAPSTTTATSSIRSWPALVPLKLSSTSLSTTAMAPPPQEDHSLENCCADCTAKYTQELSFFHEQERAKEESKNRSDGLPFWLKPKDSGTHQEKMQKIRELQRKWSQTCLSLNHTVVRSGMKGKVVTGATTAPTSSVASIPWLSLQPTTNFRVEKVAPSGAAADDALSLSLKPACREPEVATDLMLGRCEESKFSARTYGLPLLNKGAQMAAPRTLPGMNLVVQPQQQDVKVSSLVKELDFKGLCKALIENVPWQREALDTIASTVLHCRSGLEKRRNGSTKSDTWLLLLGADTMGKKKVARVLAEQVFGSEKLFTRVNLRSQAELGFARGRTSLDRVVEAVRTKPFSVVLLEGIDQADSRLKNSLVRAMDGGRLGDCSGREVSVANSIFVMTSNVGEEFLREGKVEESPFHKLGLSEKSLGCAEMVGMKLLLLPCNESCSSSSSAAGRRHDSVVLHCSERVSVVECNVVNEGEADEEESSSSNENHGELKRKAAASCVEDDSSKRSRVQVALDLNVPVEDENVTEVDNLSHASRFTNDEDGSASRQLVEKAFECLSKEFCGRLSGTVVFRPFDFDKVAELVLLEINRALVGVASGVLVEVEASVFRHLVAVLWEGQGRKEEFQDWVAQVLGNNILELVRKGSQESATVRLATHKSESSDEEALLHLPRKISMEMCR